MQPRDASVFVLVAACAASCQRAPEPGPSKDTTAPAATTPARGSSDVRAPTSAGPRDIAWDVPASWTTAENPSAMRLFTYKIPKVAGDAEDGELSVSRAGGTVDANVQRWSSQFERTASDAIKRQERTIGALRVTTVEIHGTFAGGGMPGAPSAPKPKFALLGAIVETSGAPYFFKLTGPEKTIDHAKADFDKLVQSFRPK